MFGDEKSLFWGEKNYVETNASLFPSLMLQQNPRFIDVNSCELISSELSTRIDTNE